MEKPAVHRPRTSNRRGMIGGQQTRHFNFTGGVHCAGFGFATVSGPRSPSRHCQSHIRARSFSTRGLGRVASEILQLGCPSLQLHSRWNVPRAVVHVDGLPKTNAASVCWMFSGDETNGPIG